MNEPGPTAAYLASFPSTSTGPVRPPSPPSSPLLTAQTDTLDLTHDALYALLNLPRTASDAEIRDRYRQLATVYHPDRQRNDIDRLAAHGRFTEIQRAYEILIDPMRRGVYDVAGEEGLRSGWDVGVRIKTPEEMRAHFQRQANEKRAMEVESLVKPKGDIQVVLDARAVFLPKSFFKQPERISHTPIDRLRRTRPGQIMMKHSFETPINQKTQIVWTGQMVSRGGAGGGNVVGTVKHQFSPWLWMEVGSTFMNPRLITGKGTYTFDENTFLTVNAVQQTLKAPPNVSLTLGRRLYAKTTGFITFKSGFWSLSPWGTSLPPALQGEKSALSVGLTTSDPHTGKGWTVETQAGINASRVSADYSQRILGLKMKVGGSVGTDGIQGFIDSEGKFSENIKGGMMVSAELGGGVTMRLKFSRLGQKVSLPILLSQNLNPYVVFCSTVIPAASYTAMYHFYILPRKKRRISERIQELRTEHGDYIQQKKTEAQEASALMEKSVGAKIASEREKNGLIIIAAHYGSASAFTERGMKESDMVIDVTIPIQALVTDSRLLIPGGRAKYNLLGFWDPCIGENKKIRVRYLFRGKMHQTTIDDVAVLRAPIQAHRVEE
ncbi:hypothetical protein P7C73_g2607, partial [Tremellales sp. Uapishka_1]